GLLHPAVAEPEPQEREHHEQSKLHAECFLVAETVGEALQGEAQGAHQAAVQKAEKARHSAPASPPLMRWSMSRAGMEAMSPPTTRVGTPATVLWAGTGSSIRLPAPLRAPSPTAILPRILAPMA